MTGAEALVVVEVAALAAGTFAGVKGEQSKHAALENQRSQNKLRTAQLKVAQAKKMEKVASAQRVKAASLGIDPGSSSLRAITEDSFNTFAADQKNLDLEQNLTDDAIDQQEKNVLWGAIGGVSSGVAATAATSLGNTSFSTASKKPNGLGENTDTPIENRFGLTTSNFDRYYGGSG